MRLTIESVAQKSERVWLATLDPHDLVRLATPCRQGGPLSVAFVSNPFYDLNSRSLQFDLNSFVLLNLGHSGETVLIDPRERGQAEHARTSEEQKVVSTGDQGFIKEISRLSPELKSLGEQLLHGVRVEYPGELIYKEKSGKYVESPDNFWVIRVQPRDRSFRIIVYGQPEEYREMSSLSVHKDMNGYSSFKLANPQQLEESLKTILYAKRLKDRKYRR